MKILHVVEAWRGGIASYLDALINAQIAQGHDVVLAADSHLLAADPRSLPCAVEPFAASRNPVHLPRVRAALTEILARCIPDVVHGHSTFPGVYLRCPTALHPRIIYTPHGWSFFKKDSSVWSRWGYSQIELRLAKRARFIHCMSFEELVRARSLGMDPKKLMMIHTGIRDVSAGDSLPLSVQDPHGLQVGFFGRLDYQKGADLLPEFADLLSDNVTLHVFGAPVRGDKPLPPHERIQMRGWVPHQDLASQMASMDVVVIPSRWEGFSLTALEALRVGVPIIVSDLTSLSETVVHGYNGLIMQDYSARSLADLVNSLSIMECKRMGGNARRVFEQTYTFDRFYEQMMLLYQRAVN